ncbi:MAG: hypothetical protein R3F14_00530 [Polyangiaceae bacterium]
MSAKDRRETRARATLPWLCAAAVGAALLAPGCGGDPHATAKPPPPAPPPTRGLVAFGPAQYLQQSYGWIEHTPAGTDLVVANGRRAEIKDNKRVRTAESDIDLDGGALMPAWVKGPLRYVFWDGRDLFGTTTFMGPLVKLGQTPQEAPGHAFDWIDGLALTTDTTTLVLVPGTAPDLKDTRLVPLPVPGGVTGLAADAKRAIVTNVFGRSVLTIDGGKTFRDVTEDTGEVRNFEVRGDDLVLLTSTGRDRFVGPDGKLSESAVAPGPLRGSPPPELDDTFAEITTDSLLYSIGDASIPLGDGVILVISGDTLAKIDASTGKVLSGTTLADVDNEDCVPVRVSDTLLLACRSRERAMVIDVTGVPRIERTFELETEESSSGRLDAFSVADGLGIGYLGPCSGPPPVRDEVDAISGASQRNMSAQRSPVFCARAAADLWVEHRLGPEDATDVVGWMPRPGGDAVALIARIGRYVPAEDRVFTQGGLRVVRIPRTEPPLALSGYSNRSYETASRDMRAGADGSIEAWLDSNNYGNNTLVAVIDAQGSVRTRPMPPRIDGLAHDGPFALARSDDGRLYETVDFGRRWVEVQPPPGSKQSTRPNECSAAGCSVGAFVRIGWDSVDPKLPAAAADYETARAGARALREQYEYRRPPQKHPITKLVCSYAAPGVGARQADSYGFGFTPVSTPRMGGGSNRLGYIGSFSLPWWQGPMPSSLDMDLAWVDPLDLDGVIHRASIPLSRAGVTLTHRPYEIHLGYVMDEEGRIDVIPTGPKDQCVGPVLEEAGAVLKVGSCLEDPSMGVRIKDRILLGTARWSSFAISALDLPSVGTGAAAVGSALKELRAVRTPSSFRGFTAGIGVRAGLPVGVAVDGAGQAVLAPIDPSDGYIGEAELLAPLTDLRVATDPRCPTADRLADREARVLLPFEALVGLSEDSLPGVIASGTAGVAIVRWSPDLACLESVEMTVKDDRFDPDGNNYEPPGSLRKLIARFTKAPPRRGEPRTARAAKKPPPAASASASASAAASASPALPPWASPYASPPPRPAADPSAGPTTAPIPTSPPLPRGAGEGTLLVIQFGSEMRQKLFCTGTSR